MKKIIIGIIGALGIGSAVTAIIAAIRNKRIAE